MTRRSRFTCVGAFLLTSLVAVGATAATIDKSTTFTFNTPVAVPGVTLPAGSYVFRIADVDSHQVVRVLSGDSKTAYAMFFVLQAWRSAPAVDPELTFIETAADMPHAIRTWWYPGESIGYEFLYSREQATLLARGSGTPVRSVETGVWSEPKWIPPTFFGTEPPAAGLTEPVAIETAPVGAPEAIPSEDLPTTASPLTVVLVTGIALVALAAAMQFFAIRKRT